jgi:hypothetical protein
MRFLLLLSLVLSHSFCFVTLAQDSVATSLDDEATGEQWTDYSSAPARRNVDQCPSAALEARARTQDQCRQNFQSRGLSEQLTPENIVEARSCPQIESLSEFVGGCAKGFLFDVIGGIPQALSRLSARSRFEEAIATECGPQPQNATFDSAVVAGVSSPEEQEQINSHLSNRHTYDRCADGVIRLQRARLSVDRQRTRVYETRCRNIIALRENNGATAATGRDAITDCAISLASLDGCQACVEQLSRGTFDLPLSVLRSAYDNVRTMNSLRCFNLETQGRMFCNALMVASGANITGKAAARISSELAANARTAVNRYRWGRGPRTNMVDIADNALLGRPQPNRTAARVRDLVSGRVQGSSLSQEFTERGASFLRNYFNGRYEAVDFGQVQVRVSGQSRTFNNVRMTADGIEASVQSSSGVIPRMLTPEEILALARAL